MDLFIFKGHSQFFLKIFFSEHLFKIVIEM